MRRLTLRARMGEERGAVGVMVALMLVPLLGFAAIAVDVSALYSERQELRNGADAAALAIATDCAWNPDCGDEVGTATSLIARNAGQVGATAKAPTVTADMTSQTVSVTAAADQKHWFAPVLGHDSSTVSVTSTAAWGGISQATAAVPLAISRCQYQKMVGGALTTLYPGEAAPCGTGSAAGPGVIWLNTDAGKCQTTTSVGATLSRYVPAKRTDMPATCRPAGQQFPLADVVDEQIHIPVFDQTGASFKVMGFVAFDVDDIKVNEKSARSFRNIWDWIVQLILWWLFGIGPEDHGFKAIGTLGTSVVLSDAPLQTPAPDLGARSVFLTEQR